MALAGGMEEPPVLLDGSRVLEYAVLDPSVATSGHVSVVVEGVSLDLNSICGLVIAEDLVEGGVFLLHCNKQWQTVAAGRYDRPEAARASADAAYADVTAHWRKYRELSAAEYAEVESTRAFLREIASEG